MPELYSDEYFMKQALRQAHKALDEEEIPIGAIVVMQGKKIIARAYNQTEKLNDVSAHAEMLALTSASSWLASKYLKDCTLYVTVEPCPMCAAALNWAQVDKVIYGAPDVKRGYTLFQPGLLHPKTEVRNGVLEKECASLIVDFFEKRR